MQPVVCEKVFEKAFSFWDGLSREDRELICRSTAARLYAKGENIHGGSGECTGAILVKSGCVRAYMLSEEGREITLYRLCEGELCMLSASCVLRSITFDVFVDAEEDSECYVVSSKALGDLMARDLRVENFFLNQAVGRFSDVMWVMQQILFMSVDKRLAVFLLDEMNKTKASLVPLTQEQIARYTGSAREVVSRMLKRFSADGVARSVRGGVEILDTEKLRRLAL